MKLLDITNFYGEQSGGVRTYLDRKIEYIKKRGDIEHTLIIPGERDEVTQRGRTKILRLKGTRVPFYPSYRLVLNIPKIKRKIEEESADMIELGDPYTMAWAVFLSKRDAQIIGLYHADLPSYFKRYLHTRAAERVAWSYVRWIYNRCSLVLAPSDEIKAQLKSEGIKNVERIFFYGVDTSIFSPEKRDDALRERFSEKTILIYVGRLAREKHLEVLVSAFRMLDKYHLFVVGDGPYRKEMENSLRENATFFGYTRDRDVLARLYASADIFVTPSPTETFGITALEALASGLPVVCVNRGGIKDVVTEDVGAFAEADNVKDFAKKIEALAERMIQKERLIERAKRFSWDSAFERLFKYYEIR